MSSLRSSMVYMYVVLPSSFVSLVLIMVQLLGLRPLGLFPQSFNTQQIDQEMVCSSVWRIEWGMRLFIMLGPCLFLMYIFRLGQLGYELSFFKDGEICSRSVNIASALGSPPARGQGTEIMMNIIT